jgi:hypothetical protein
VKRRQAWRDSRKLLENNQEMPRMRIKMLDITQHCLAGISAFLE